VNFVTFEGFRELNQIEKHGFRLRNTAVHANYGRKSDRDLQCS